MSNKKKECIALLGGLCFSGFVLAQDVYDQPDDITKIKPLFQFLSSGTDYVPTNDYNEPNSSNDQQGILFYLMESDDGSMTTLNRLYNGVSDHMVSELSQENGYNPESELGHVYANQNDVLGLSGLHRWVNTSTGLHAFSYAEDSTLENAGYQNEGALGYAYKRPGALCEDPHDFDPHSYTDTNGQVKVTLNQAAGGVITDLWWMGKQFVNNYDYGRQIQTAHRYDEATYQSRKATAITEGRWNTLWDVAEVHNPTEGGSTHSCPGTNFDSKKSQGSQLLSITEDSATHSIETITRPLLFRGDWFGGGEDMPIMWDGTYTKTLTVGYANVPNIIKVEIELANKSAHDSMNWELLTGYFNHEFNKYYFYDAVLDDLDSKTPTLGQCLGHATAAERSKAGGPIVATVDGSYAIGFYRRRNVAATNEWAVCNFINDNGGTEGRTGSDSSKISMMHSDQYVSGVEADTTYSDVTYIVVGTLANVQTTMAGMYVDSTNFPALD